MVGASTGERAELADLRERMRARGLGYEEIAGELARRYRLRPRQAWRHAYGWTLMEAAAQINAVAATIGADQRGRAPMTGAHLSEYEQWPGQGRAPTGRKPTPQVLALLAAAYNTGMRDLLDIADYEKMPASDLLVLEKRGDRRSEAPARGPAAIPAGTPADEDPEGPRGWSGSELVIAAARESTRFAAGGAGRQVTGVIVDQLQEDVLNIARAYSTVPAARAFAEARRLRDLGCELLQQTRRPSQEADLYLAVGVTCGLLATASFDLSCWGAATEQARASWVYASQIGHAGLMSWAKGMQALVAYWSGDPASAVTLAGHALEVSPPGTPTVRVRCIEARARAYLGQAEETERAIAGAEAAREQADGQDDLHDQMGGHFSFDAARQARCHASAYLQLGKTNQATTWAEAAIDMYSAMPLARRWPKIEAEAHADLAAARLIGGDLEGACEALAPVLDVPGSIRVAGLRLRVQRVADLLISPAYQESAPARRLRSQVTEFSHAPDRAAIGS